DFTQGQDKIDLSGIDANPTLDGDQAFTFIADPTHYTGDWTGVVWQTTGANGIATINVSIDGDATPEMTIYMSHPYQFTAGDFILYRDPWRRYLQGRFPVWPGLFSSRHCEPPAFEELRALLQ